MHNETARGTHHAHATAISLHAGRGTRFSSSASLLGRSALDVCRSSATLEWRPSAGSAPAQHQSQRGVDLSRAGQGHASMATTARYVIPSVETSRSASDKASDAIMAKAVRQ